MERGGHLRGPSLYEPFGLAPLEAALRGCALVLSDIGSFRELWDGCAAFFPRGDAEVLAAVLAELEADPKRGARLANPPPSRALRVTPRPGWWTGTRRCTASWWRARERCRSRCGSRAVRSS
jgi:glycosyltransferase involved in cell wall biosynthesis